MKKFFLNSSLLRGPFVTFREPLLDEHADGERALFNRLVSRRSGSPVLMRLLFLFQIGNVRTLLESRGMLDGTYVVITSDHGFHLGQFGMPVDKRLPYETDIRVPLVIVGPPGSGKRQIADELVVVSVDLAPTVLAMAGISTPRHMDGASLLPLLEQVTRPSKVNEAGHVPPARGLNCVKASFRVIFSLVGALE